MTHRLLLAAGLAASASAATAACDVPAGEVRVLSNDHSALTVIGDWIERECGEADVTFSANLTTEHADIQGPALTVSPAEYDVVIIANSSLTALLNEGLVRPLDDLVAEFGQDLAPNQLIKVNGETVAVAFMANAQHFFYREDVLAEAGVAPPTTWEEVLAAAEAIRSQGIMEYPLGSTMLPEWSLAQEWVNMYLGLGGPLFEPGSAVAAIDEAKAVEALETLKSLSGYMNPDYLTFDSDNIVPIWNAGEMAMMQLWGSQAVSFDPDTSGAPEIAAETRLAAAPAAVAGGPPATTVWWDGFAIAANLPDEDAERAFRTMMVGLSPEMAAANPNAATWLVEGWTPTPIAEGVIASVQGGAPSYSMLPYMGLLHDAFGANLAAYFTGGKSAEQAVADALRDYETSATQAGYLD